ncbi:P-loop containing nucleoside triphosphate hydrolase protein [Kockovaella imperatae]|uniref:p-loop containing nucleoside triphosphate hydrolase protein n=1 Tax=Kockovaella imperatae TaxID=4999 RepID=A0A1Y1UR99_9TREE|nr:P-loop containing nucleoside triphosphate hydrolase protein [Kockovaella imperatae]ORX40598.1 P-loop containing nucleoside triphosphate hydrolase protein [Kockovaella imperatae]
MTKLPLVRLPPNATIHRLGTASTARKELALLRFPPAGWTIDRDTTPARGWAIVGDSEGRRLAVETLLSRHRIHPITSPPGPFPYITHISTPPSPFSNENVFNTSKPVRHLSFARPPTTGEFTDFTARYGALQEDDKITFRQTLSSLDPTPPPDAIESVSKKMQIDHLLDLPSVSLSSGQTRRARIAAALLTKPVLLIFEDPMSGLDVNSRDQVSAILGEINAKCDPAIVLVLRGKTGDIPAWVTDICEIRDGNVWIGSREVWEQEKAASIGSDIHQSSPEVIESSSPPSANEAIEPVVAMSRVSISYGEGSRPVLKDISWSILPGEKWHLQGSNGSGKTTLLSLVLGHHPRSFSLPAESLTLFSKPRRMTPTPILRTMIGHTSPEIYAAFPRGMGLTATEAVGSGFEGVFSRRQLNAEQKERVRSLLGRFIKQFTPTRYDTGSTAEAESVTSIGRRPFAHFTAPQQALLLFLRAVVSRPKLLVLDEPSQGLDEVTWDQCCQLLEAEWKEMPEQAVIVVSHYDDEVPWSKSRGRVLKLADGHATLS